MVTPITLLFILLLSGPTLAIHNSFDTEQVLPAYPNTIENQPISLLQDTLEYKIGKFVSYYEDKDKILTIEAVIEDNLLRKEDSRFTFIKNNSDVLNPGFSSSTYWVRIDIAIERGTFDKKWLLEVQYPTLNEVEFYYPTHPTNTHTSSLPEYSHWKTGTDRLFNSRPIKHQNFVFPLHFKSRTTDLTNIYTFYLKTSATNSIQIPLKIWEENAFFRSERIALPLWGLYYGTLLVMFLYNAFIFISVREKSYLYYIFYIASCIFGMASLNGHGFEYLWPNTPSLNKISLTVFICSLVFFASTFGKHFLDTKTYAPQTGKVLPHLQAAAVILILLSFIMDYDFSQATAVLCNIFCLVLLVISFDCMRNGSRAARFFVIAWTLFLGGGLLFVLALFGIIPSNIITTHAKELGTAWEVILISLGLADRLNHEISEKTLAVNAQNEAMRNLHKIEKTLAHRSCHDTLTGLPNRSLLELKLAHILVKSRTKSTNIGLLVLRLNQFHEIDNTLGKQNHNKILKLASTRLSNVSKNLMPYKTVHIDSKNTERVAYIEDGVFAIVIESSAPHNEAIQTVETVLETMKQPVDYQGMAIDLGPSVGLAFYPDHGKTPGVLIQHAQIAEEAARVKHDSYAMYSSFIDPYSTRRLALMGELREALKENGLELYFQPQVNVSSSTLVGVEALLRWHHPTHGFIPPEEFIPLAEKAGLMRPLTHWIFDTAISYLASLSKKGFTLQMAINLSAKNLREFDLVEQLMVRLETHQVSPHSLVLEVTETAMMEDPELALSLLRQMDDNGIHISIDDFGTGYSSLSYLSKLPVKELKIDRAFVSGMLERKEDMTIVQATISMSHSLGLTIVAEGVEEDEILQVLNRIGCDIVQGNYISQPLAGADFERWLNNCPFNVEIKRKLHQPSTNRDSDDPSKDAPSNLYSLN